MESLTFQERLQRWNNPTALEQLSVTARSATATKLSEVVCCPSRYEEKKLTVDKHALKELAFQMAAEGKQLGMQLDSLHQTLSEEALKCEHQEALSADLRKRACGIGKEVRALGRRVEELEELLRKGKEDSGTAKEIGPGLKHRSSLEELKARLEILETEKQCMLEERREREREIQFLQCQLQYRGEMKVLQETNDLAKLEEDNALLRKENLDLHQKLDSLTGVVTKQPLTDDNKERPMSVNSPSEASETRKAGIETELEILRKERKILLATLLKQQTAEKDSHKRDGTVGSERDQLRKKVEGLISEITDLRKDNKTLDDENSKLVEEKRALEDQVDKLKIQITDALESSFDEIEHLSQSNEALQERFNLLKGQNKRLREASNEFKEKCASHFEEALVEIEEKQSYEDVLDYLTDAIDHLLDFDDEATALAASYPQSPTDKAVGSSLLEEIKMCKDLIENQRLQIRQIQFDKRDLEESLSKMRRELIILKSEKRQGKCQDVVQAGQHESNAEEDRNNLTQQNETTQQEIGYLKSRQSELENLAKALKEDNCKLENEKFCLLGSFYHLLERSEALEERMAKMRQGDVITTDETAEPLSQENEKLPDDGNVPAQSLMELEEVAKGDESTDDLKCEIRRIGDRLRDVQEFVLDTEGEKRKLMDELGEGKKREGEFGAIVMQLNQELTVLKGRVEKVQETNDTLQDCLREVHDEKQELVASLGESNEEKIVLERSLADMKDKMNNLRREKDALQNDAGYRHEQMDKAIKQHLKIVCEKLSELVTVLETEEVSSRQTETKEPTKSEIEPEIEELSKRSSLLLDKMVEESEGLITARNRYKLDNEKSKIRLDALLIEKQALQKYVRELDERKRQMKVFITRLTEEKEALAEDIDEVKQQKTNLADALENVYHNKEIVQNKLEEATLKVEQLRASLRQSAEESKTLRESLCRVVKDRDAVKVALLDENRQVQRLRESEGKWRELAMGSHTEADQIIEVDRAIKEEMVNGRLKVEESQAIVQLKAERDELLKRVDSILMAKEATKVDDDNATCEPGRVDETIVCVEENQVEKERVTDILQNVEERETEEAQNMTAEHLAPLQNGAEFADKEDVPFHATTSPVVCEKCREEKETLETMLKQSTEENEQLKNWLDAVFVEKGRLEQELENTAEENKDLIRDLQRSSDDKEKLKLLLQKISGDKESQLDDSNALKGHNGPQKQVLDEEDGPDKQLEKLRDCEGKNSDTLVQTVKELTENCTAMETNVERAQKDIRDLTNQINAIQRENREHVASLEKATDSNRALDKKYQQLMEDNQRLKDLNTESVQQADAIRLDNGMLSESNTCLTEDLKNSRKTLEKTLQRTQELRKEIKSLSENNQKDAEKAKEQESELKERLKVAQQACDGMAASISELNVAKEKSEARCQQLADELEHVRATAKEKVAAEEHLHTLKKEVEKSKSDLMAKEEKLSMIEEGLQILLSVSEEGDGRLDKEAILQDPLNQLKAVRQTLERRAEETKEFGNCLNSVQEKVNELKAFTKSLGLEEVHRNSLTDDVPIERDMNKTNYQLVGETIGNSLGSVQKGFEEILTQKALAAKKLEGEVVTSEEKAVKLARELDKLREDLSMARKSNEREQEKLKHVEGESKIAKKTNQELKQELQAARNTITELRTEQVNTAELLNKKDKHIDVVTSEKMQALEELNNEVTSLAVAKDGLEKTLKETQESVCDSKLQLEKSRKHTRSLQQEKEGISKQLRKKQNENEDLKLCVSKMDKEKSNIHKVLKDLESKNLELQKRVKETESDNSKLAEEYRELAGQKREQESSLKEMSEGKNNLEKKLKEQAEWNKSTLSKFEETRKALSKLQEERKDLKACVASLDKDKRTLQKQLKDIETKLEQAREIANDKQSRLKDLEDLLKNATKEKESSSNELEKENRRLNRRKQELDSRIKEMDAEVRNVTDKKKRLEKELSSEKGISEDLRRRVDEANKDKNELEEILEQQRSNYKNLKDKLEKTAFQKQAAEEKLTSALAKLEKAEDELRGKTSYLEERDVKLKQSEDEIKALRRKLDEHTEDEVSAVRKKLEVNQLEKELSNMVQQNEALSERLNEADTKISVLKKKVQQQDDERDENKRCIERSQQASSRLDVALESAKEEESRLRKQLEESKDRERVLKSKLQEMIGQAEQISPPSTSAVQQECAVERVLVTCADVPELSQVSNESSTCTEDKNNDPNFESAKKEVVLLESQVRKLRSELRMANDQVFDLQQELSDSNRALRQKERLHQQERTRFQEDIEEIERECDEMRKKLLCIGEVEARRSSFSTVMDLKGTLRKAESDMWDVISKTARLLERAKDEMKEVAGKEEEKPAIPQMNVKKEDLRKKVHDLEKQKNQLEKKLRRAEGLKEMLKQTVVDTLADVYKFLHLVSRGSESSDINANNPTTLRKKRDKENSEAQRDQEVCSLQETEKLCSQLDELRKIIKDVEHSIGKKKSTLGHVQEKDILETGSVLQNDELQQDGIQSRDEEMKRTVPECTLHKTQEAVKMLQTEKEALEAQCSALQGKVREVAEGKNQLLENALSFKVKCLKKNQELTSLLETKEHDVLSLQTKNEGLNSHIQKIEGDLLKSENEVESLRLQSHAAKSEKERVERVNEEQQFELENLRSRHNELNVKLKQLSSEICKLEDRNKALLEEKSKVAQEYGVEKAGLLQERDAIASRLREMEEENRLESSLKEVREDHLREKEQKLIEESASVQKEKQNLGNVKTKIQQMRDEYTRLESEYNVLLESVNETKRENTALRKENSLVRKACDQLRVRKNVAEEKILEEVVEVDVESVPSLEDKPERAIIKENVIPLHRAAAKRDDFPFKSDFKAFKRHSIAHSTTDHTDGLLIPISLSGQKRDTFLDRRRACSLPTQQEPTAEHGRAGTKLVSHDALLSPLSSSGGSSSRSSEADSSVCSKRHYCSPILSVVDMCPLHHGSPLERKPSPCPVCRKKERKNPKEFVSSEKYV